MTNEEARTAAESFIRSVDVEGVLLEAAYLLWPMFFGVAMGMYALTRTTLAAGCYSQASLISATGGGICSTLVQAANTGIWWASGTGLLFLFISVVLPVLLEGRE